MCGFPCCGLGKAVPSSHHQLYYFPIICSSANSLWQLHAENRWPALAHNFNGMHLIQFTVDFFSAARLSQKFFLSLYSLFTASCSYQKMKKKIVGIQPACTQDESTVRIGYLDFGGSIFLSGAYVHIKFIEWPENLLLLSSTQKKTGHYNRSGLWNRLLCILGKILKGDMIFLKVSLRGRGIV